MAVSLAQQGKHTEAMEIEREVLVQKTRMLGAEHEETLFSEGNLGLSLSRYGRQTEAEQLLRDTFILILNISLTKGTNYYYY